MSLLGACSRLRAEGALAAKRVAVLTAVEVISCHPCFMSDTKHVVLIHGSWSRGEQWAPARAAFEERSYTVRSVEPTRDTRCETRNETTRPGAKGGGSVAPEGVSFFYKRDSHFAATSVAGDTRCLLSANLFSKGCEPRRRSGRARPRARCSARVSMGKAREHRSCPDTSCDNRSPTWCSASRLAFCRCIPSWRHR